MLVDCPCPGDLQTLRIHRAVHPVEWRLTTRSVTMTALHLLSPRQIVVVGSISQVCSVRLAQRESVAANRMVMYSFL